jgi:hypothetical protein
MSESCSTGEVPVEYLPVCSRESRRSPKPLDRVRLLAPVLFADVARLRMPCECAGSTAAFEAAGLGPIPRRGTGVTDCPRSVAEARDSAKVEGQVRLLAGALVEDVTLEPDGQAAACKAASSGFDSRTKQQTVGWYPTPRERSHDLFDNEAEGGWTFV